MGQLYQRGRIWWIKCYAREYRPGQGENRGAGPQGPGGRVATGQPILLRADRVRYEEVAKDLRQKNRSNFAP